MARLRIASGSLKLSEPGFEVTTAPNYLLMLSTDHTTSQVVAHGVSTFGGADTCTATLPSGYSGLVVDFYYADVSGGVATTHYEPANRVMTVAGSELHELWSTTSGTTVTFTRRGGLSGQANRGIRWYAYYSPAGGPGGPAGKRIQIGGGVGLRISSPGVDVTTATDAQLQFSSDRWTPWLWGAFSGIINNGTTASISFPATLSEPPITRVYMRLVDGGLLQVPSGQAVIDFGPGTLTLPARIVTTTTGITVENQYGANYTFDIFIYRIT